MSRLLARREPVKRDIKEASFHYLCRNCDRPMKVALPTTNRGYSYQLKRECLKIYVNGMGLRAIERGHCVFIIQL